MSSILPLRSEPQTGGRDPRVVDLDGDEADAVFSALSSGTARQIIAALHSDPKTQSEIADAIDTSVQNVRYHLDKLEDAGLVEVVDTWYSSRGNEMKVYAPADAALIVSGDESRASRLKAALSRLVGGVGVVALASLVVQTVASELSTPTIGLGSSSGDAAPAEGAGGADGNDGAGDGAVSETEAERAEDVQAEQDVTRSAGEDADDAGANGDGPGGTDANVTDGEELYSNRPPGDDVDAERVSVDHGLEPEGPGTGDKDVGYQETTGGDPNEEFHRGETTDTAVETTETATDVATTTDAAVEAAASADPGGLPPGLAFFLGGVTVLVVVIAIWYWSTY
jgi:DNA-binding transcriptional ArsR family regulator